MLILMFLSFYPIIIMFLVSVLLEWYYVSFSLIMIMIFWIIFIPFIAIYYDTKHQN